MRLALALVLLGLPAAAQDLSPERLFVRNCSACHQRNGRGIPKAFPALDGDALVQGEPQAVVAVLLNGRGGMPSFRTQLTDAQIAGVLTYVRGAWSNHADPIEEGVVAALRTAQAVPEVERGLQAH